MPEKFRMLYRKRESETRGGACVCLCQPVSLSWSSSEIQVIKVITDFSLIVNCWDGVFFCWCKLASSFIYFFNLDLAFMDG